MPRLRFLGQLDELVAVGLFRPAFEALCRGDAEAIPTPIDRVYLSKILTEEVGRQFGHPLRPIIELILNGADAIRGTPGAIDIHVEEAKVIVADSGAGMSLATILSKLLLPFSTDKVPDVDIGRFGVGFFSALGFGAAHPASFSLQVETGDGIAGWSVCVIAAGPDVADLSVSIRSTAPRSGTTVKLASALLEAGPLRAYLRDALHFFPSKRAILRLDGAPLNDGSLISGGRLYEDHVTVEPGGPPLCGRFHLGGRGLAPGITAATYHAGVKVDSCFAIAELALLDFPAAVELTLGRDAIKPGPRFAAVAGAFYRRLIQIAAEQEEGCAAPGSPGGSAGSPLRCRVAELAAQISALLLKDAAWSEAAPELARALLGPDRFLIGSERVEGVKGFLGPEVTRRIFVPESFWAEQKWQAFLPGERELLDDELSIDRADTLAALVHRRPDLAGLPLLAARASRPDTLIVALVRGRSGAPPGPMPCLGSRRGVLVRDDCIAVRAPRGWSDLYALRAAFDRAVGTREADVERELIVSAPLGRDGLRWTIRGLGGTGTGRERA